MNHNPVPQRLLERLRLGELNDRQAADVMQRLDAEPGGAERLEALIAADEAFLERYPTHQWVPRIQRRFEQRQIPTTPNPITSSRFAVPALIAVVLSVVVAVTLIAQNTDRTTSTVQERHPVRSAEPAAPVAPPPRVARAAGPGHRAIPLDELLLAAEGEIVTLEASGVTKIVSSDTRIADVVGGGSVVYVEGYKKGETTLMLNGTSATNTLRVRVAPTLQRSDIEPTVLDTADELDRCVVDVDDSETAMKLRFLTNAKGRVRLIQTQWSSLPTTAEQCVLNVARKWSFAVDQPRTGTWKVTASAGGVCEPGEDC